MDDKPAFDPTQPFEPAPVAGKPAFDPSKPFEPAPTQSLSAGETAADVAKSGGIGLAKGAIGLAGLPGDVGSLVSAGADKLGVPESVKSAVKSVGRHVPVFGAMAGPTSQDIQQGVEGVTGEFYKPKTTLGEYAQTAGEFAPAVIGGPETMLAKLGTRVAAPAFVSETAGQLTKGTAAEPYARAAGAIASPAFGAAGRRLVTPLPATAERQAAVQALQHEGVDALTAGQRTGSRPLQWFEQALGDIPGSGRGAATAAERQAEQYTRAALRRVGEDAPRATPEVIDNAFNRIGGQFEDIAARNHVRLDPRLGNDLHAVETEYNNLVGPSSRAGIVANTIRDVGDMAAQHGGILPGDVYGAMRSRLGRMARGASADRQLSDAIYGMQHALDDAMTRSLQRAGNNQDIAALAQARRQYRNMLVIERAATGAGENAASGLISPAKLREATVAQGRRGYARGQGDFAGLARSGEAVMRPLPQSGTAPRSYAQQLPALVGGGIGGTLAGVPGALGGAAAAVAGPPLAGRALMSRPAQAYLGNQVMAGPHQPGLTPRQLAVMRSVYAAPEVRDANHEPLRLTVRPQDALGAQDQGRAKGGRVWHPKHLGAKRAKDGHWYLKDENRPGKYLRVERKASGASRSAP